MIQTTHTVPFVLLRVRSLYSVGSGISSPRDICMEARRSGYSAIALTDVGGTFGYIEFHRAARDSGVKPIYGVSFRLRSDDGAESAAGALATVILVALDSTGLRNLCELTSLARGEGTADASISGADLEQRPDGLACIVAAESETITEEEAAIQTEQRELDAPTREDVLSRLHRHFRDRLYVGITPGTPASVDWAASAGEVGISTVLLPDVRYVGPIGYPVAGDRAADDTEELSPGGAELPSGFRLPALSEMSAAYARYREAYANASMVASRVSRDLLDPLDSPAPTPGLPSLFDESPHAERELRELLEAAFARAFPGSEAPGHDRYRRILSDEIEAITRAGAAEAFVRFHGVVSRLRDMGATIGPATGLRLQSFAAYLLGITVFDPYRVDEKFSPDLDPESVSHRILDLQIAGSDRAALQSVLSQLFDRSGIGYLPAVEHVTPARALRAAAQDLEISARDLDEITRQAAEHPGIGLKQLCDENPIIGRLYQRSRAVRDLLSRAAAVEGLPAGFIRSKRTVLLSTRPLRHYIGWTVHAETGEAHFQSIRDVWPTASSFRIDVMTLRSLGVFAGVVRTLGERGVAIPGWDPVFVDDPAVLARVARADVDGVYLLEAPLAQRLAATFGVSSWATLMVFLALMRYRRGDLSFAARLNVFEEEPAPVEGRDPSVSHLLADTKGWILYQDQLRDILSALIRVPADEAAGLLLRFRRRDSGRLAGLRRDFMGRAAEAEVPMETAKAWFNRILFHADRALDRQQIVAEALLVHRMLWLKHHHRAAFLAALLNEHREQESRFAAYMQTVAAESLLVGPHVNHSGREFREERGLIRAPLGWVKGLSERAIGEILSVRGEGKFHGLEDFLRRVRSEFITNEEVERLVRSGAIDAGPSPPPSPGPTPASVPKAEPPQGDERQLDLRLPGQEGGKISGKYMRGSNIRGRFRVLRSVAEFFPHSSASEVELVGRIRDLHSFRTSSGDETWFFMLFDSSASVPVFASRDAVGRSGEPPTNGDHVLVRGKVRVREGRKVCDAVEIIAAEGGARSDGETASHEPAEGDS